MGRKIGDVNFKPRKDKGKRRKRYAGKLVKKKVTKRGRLIPYESKRKSTDPVKIWFWELKKISKESMKNFSRISRPHMRRTSFNPGLRVDVEQERLSSKDEVEEMAVDVLGYPGEFYIMGFGHSKNKYKVSPFKLCHIKIIDNGDGTLTCKMLKNFRLYRYKWWDGRRRRTSA